MDFATLFDVKLQDDLAHLVFVDNPINIPPWLYPCSQWVCVSDQAQQGEALTYSGVAVIHPAMFAGLENGKRPLALFTKQAMLEQQITASKMQGVWVDVGTPERLNVLDQQIKQGLYD